MSAIVRRFSLCVEVSFEEVVVCADEQQRAGTAVLDCGDCSTAFVFSPLRRGAQSHPPNRRGVWRVTSA
jgi:hypothetical protein